MGLAQDLIEAGIFTEIETYEREADKYSPGGTTYVARWGGEGSESFSTLPHKYKDIDDFAALALESFKDWIRTSREFAEKMMSETQEYRQRMKALGV
jgi:hypothetical protein